MPVQTYDLRQMRLAMRNKGGVLFGEGLLSDGTHYYGSRGFLADGLYGSPLSIPSLWAYWDMSALGLANGAGVTSVSEVSGLGNAPALTNVAGTPTYNTNDIGGLGTVNQASANRLGCTVTNGATGPITTFQVYKKVTAATSPSMFRSTNSPAWSTSDTTTTLVMNYGTNISAAHTPDTNAHILIAVGGTSGNLYFDASTAFASGNTGSNGITASTSTLSFNSNTTSTIRIAECAIFSAALNASEVAALGAWAASKYGLTWGP